MTWGHEQQARVQSGSSKWIKSKVGLSESCDKDSKGQSLESGGSRNLAARPARPGRSSHSPYNYSASFSQALHEATATLTSTTEEENEDEAG